MIYHQGGGGKPERACIADVMFWGRGPSIFSHVSNVTDRANYANVGICKPQKTSPAHTAARLFWVERWQHMKALLCRSSRDSWEDREFYQAKAVKTHSNNLVMLAHVQLMPFYRLFTRDVTHVRKCTRPSPSLPHCKRCEAGLGPGKEAKLGVKCEHDLL